MRRGRILARSGTNPARSFTSLKSMYPIFSTVNLHTRLRRHSRESPAGSAGGMLDEGAGEEYEASEASGRGRRGFVLRATFWPCLTSSSIRTERNLRTLSESRILRCTSATQAAGARNRKLWYVASVLFLMT